MSSSVPEEVREAMARAIDPPGEDQNGRLYLWYPQYRSREETARLIIDAALSALEAAGFEVNRKGTAIDCPLAPDTELWADGAHLIARWPEHYTEVGCCGNALPSGECCGNAIPVPAVAEHVEKVADGDPGLIAYFASLHNAAMLTASRHKEKQDG